MVTILVTSSPVTRSESRASMGATPAAAAWSAGTRTWSDPASWPYVWTSMLEARSVSMSPTAGPMSTCASDSYRGGRADATRYPVTAATHVAIRRVAHHRRSMLIDRPRSMVINDSLLGTTRDGRLPDLRIAPTS